MILTDKVTYLHFPKSGGTFVTKMMENLYEKTLIPAHQKKNFIAKIFTEKPFYIDYKVNKYFKGIQENRDNHNGVSHIPSKHIDKPIFTTVRDPLEFYVSYYKTKKWVTETQQSFPDINNQFPSFPDINFTDFITLVELYYINKIFPKLTGLKPNNSIGLYTMLFILIYCQKPIEVFSLLENVTDKTEEYLIIKKHLDSQITFLNFDNLNENVYDYLSKFYNKKHISFIFEMERENVNKESKPWQEYYTPSILEKIKTLDSSMIKFYEKV